ncbi:adenylate/guanylate cyclase domain-containing protein [Sneathiella litorea]|uniref:2Fe-2S iron-sulfur cluster binding domain-containing protein n=1 Tax=Sneathiella litorea TaxID=2606216 RepID=A0A6L8W491_9PROT|nr:adenylate/guanylate cyclase domain-containing protein [Sneathiella litorea]MZR29901.1 2Fe-2S iron-sulfur cluster binding domain-containing protein [Sneathiella litorea]
MERPQGLKRVASSIRIALRPDRIRLASGVILMVFLTGHLLNHALGLISLNAMEVGRDIFLALWRSVPGTILLLGAISLHIALVFYKLLRHRSYRRLSGKDILQITLGLFIPPLVILHIIGTRVAHEIYGLEDSYTFVLFSLWVATPTLALLQSIALIVAWIHGCLGIHFWLRLKPWYEKKFSLLYSLALILPVISLSGFINGANEVERLFADADWRDAFFARLDLPPDLIGWAYTTRDIGFLVMFAALGVLILSRLYWTIRFRRRKVNAITYPDEKIVLAAPGLSILEASQLGNIPHASVCGGRGRCSTCRVRIMEGWDKLNPPSDKEIAVLRRVGAPEGTRLACQSVPTGDVSVIPLLPTTATVRQAFNQPAYLQGQEREIAILFADLRAFTKFSEQKLPYDVVFVINQYFRHMGEAIEENGGHLDKFIGDGVMALFGLSENSKTASRMALNAARSMANELEIMNENLKTDLPSPLKIGIGIHVGQVIVGQMGYGSATSITAIGDPVNTASRLESLTKEYASQLIFSDKVAKFAEDDFSELRHESVDIRGRVEPLGIYIVKDARRLPYFTV